MRAAAGPRSNVQIILVLTFLLLSASAPAFASYPAPVDDYVNDYAGLLNAPDKQMIGSLLKDLEYKTGIEMTLVIVNSIKDYSTEDATAAAFAKNLFNAWGVGHKDTNNGIMMLVAVADRDLRIELGGGYDKSYDAKMQEVINDKILPSFRQEDYSRGIYEGVRGVISKVTKKVSFIEFYWPHLLIGLLIIVFMLAGLNFLQQGKKGWGWAFLAVAGFLIIILIKLLASGKSRSGFGGGSSFGGGASGSW